MTKKAVSIYYYIYNIYIIYIINKYTIFSQTMSEIAFSETEI